MLGAPPSFTRAQWYPLGPLRSVSHHSFTALSLPMGCSRPFVVPCGIEALNEFSGTEKPFPRAFTKASFRVQQRKNALSGSGSAAINSRSEFVKHRFAIEPK